MLLAHFQVNRDLNMIVQPLPNDMIAILLKNAYLLLITTNLSSRLLTNKLLYV